MILNLLRNEVIGKPLDAHVAKFADAEVAANVLPKRMLISSYHMAPLPTFVRRKTDSAIADKRIVSRKAPKKEQVPDVETYKDVNESRLSCSAADCNGLRQSKVKR